MTSNDDMDLLDDDEFPLIKEGSPPPTGMDTNMVFMLPSEFKGAEEEVPQMCLGPKEAMFEKPEESSQHLKPLYVWGHNDGKPISWMLIDGGTTVNLITYYVLKKLGREDDELMKSNLMLNMELTIGSKLLATAFFIIEVKVTIVSFLAAIEFTPIIAFLLLCINP
jgi:hypothetical protein